MNVNVVNKQNSNSSNKKKSNTSVVFSIFCRKLLKNPFLWKKNYSSTSFMFFSYIKNRKYFSLQFMDTQSNEISTVTTISIIKQITFFFFFKIENEHNFWKLLPKNSYAQGSKYIYREIMRTQQLDLRRKLLNYVNMRLGERVLKFFSLNEHEELHHLTQIRLRRDLMLNQFTAVLSRFEEFTLIIDKEESANTLFVNVASVEMSSVILIFLIYYNIQMFF